MLKRSSLISLGTAPNQGASVQLAVRDRDLDEFVGSPASQRLARLESDTEITLRLALQGYEGPEWKEVATALVEYAHTVMRAWIATGLIYRKCAARKILLKPQPRDEDDVCALADETVTRALHSFKETVLKRNRWDRSKGASLGTFFVGHCLIKFGNVYRRWSREQCLPPLSEEKVLDGLLSSRNDQASPWRVIELALQESRHDRNSPAAVTYLMELGWSAEEIAAVLKISVSAVENRAYHHRRKGRKA